jgi:hypothetical protein
MRNLLIRTLAGGTLLLALGAFAQDYPRDRDGDRYYDRDDRGGYREGRGYRGRLIEQVRSDLGYARSAVYSRGEAKRLDKASEELGEFQRKWNGAGSTVTSWMTPSQPSKELSITMASMSGPALRSGTTCSASAIFARNTTAADIIRDRRAAYWITVPTATPIDIRMILPFVFRLNTMMGR